MENRQSGGGNRIISAQSSARRRAMAAHLEPVDLSVGDVLNEAGAQIADTYFPTSCMVSLVAVADGLIKLEVGLVGRDGMVGVGIALGVDESPVRAIVQAKGSAIRIPAPIFSKALESDAKLRAEAHRFAYTSMATAMLLAACNSEHGLEARLARWLLMEQDCMCTATFETTQDSIGQKLGVRRTSVTIVASELQRRGLISYSRGVVKLLDVAGLKAAACSCYPKIRRLSSAFSEATLNKRKPAVARGRKWHQGVT